MDPVEPWIDSDAVRRMAARLISTEVEPEIGDRPDTGFGPAFEGFLSDDPPVPAKEPPPAEAPPPAQVPPPLPGGSLLRNPSSPRPLPPPSDEFDPPAKPFLRPAEDRPAPAAAAFQVRPAPPRGIPGITKIDDDDGPRGLLVERMEKFRDWLVKRADARGVFVLDREGSPVLDDPSYAKLRFLARSLAQAYRPVEGQPGNVHVKVGSDTYLVVVPVDTAFGCLVLGAVLPAPLDASEVEAVSKVLAEAARPQ